MSLPHSAHLNSPSSPTRTSERTSETTSAQSPEPCQMASGRPRPFSRAPQPRPCSYGRNAQRQTSRVPSPLSERAESSPRLESIRVYSGGGKASSHQAKYREANKARKRLPKLHSPRRRSTPRRKMRSCHSLLCRRRNGARRQRPHSLDALFFEPRQSLWRPGIPVGSRCCASSK